MTQIWNKTCSWCWYYDTNIWFRMDNNLIIRLYHTTIFKSSIYFEHWIIININLNAISKLCNLEVIAPISKKLYVPFVRSKTFWSGERNSKCLEHEYDTKQHKDSSQATAQTTTYDTYCFGRRGVVDEKGRTEAHLWNRWVYSPLYMNQMRYITIAETPLLLLG